MNIASGAPIDYDWDHRNRLVGITYKDANANVTEVIDYTYDVNNHRIAKDVDADGSGHFTWREVCRAGFLDHHAAL